MPDSCSPLNDGFTEAVTAAWPPERWLNVHVVAAVSGGADSVAMLRGLHDIKRALGGEGRLIAAHFNHGLRGDASDADEAFVHQLCETLSITLACGKAVSCGKSEQSARDARYAFLRQTATTAGARYVCTAHTRDDQAETILLRVLRGTGIAGLAGIPTSRVLADGVTIVRPLLGVNRTNVERFLASTDQPFCQDKTNEDDGYTRNWVRNHLLPTICDRLGDGVEDALIGLGENAAESQAWIEGRASDLLQRAIQLQADGDRIEIDCSAMQAAPPLLVREAFRMAWRQAGWPEQAMGRVEWRLLADFIMSNRPEPITLPGAIRVRREDGQVVLAPS